MNTLMWRKEAAGASMSQRDVVWDGAVSGRGEGFW